MNSFREKVIPVDGRLFMYKSRPGPYSYLCDMCLRIRFGWPVPLCSNMKLSFFSLLAVGYLCSVCHGQTNPLTCSASTPCQIGCCNNYGICGYGPNYCGSSVCNAAGSANGTCAQLSECDPGGYPGYGAMWGMKL
jgi:hypothetical protein